MPENWEPDECNSSFLLPHTATGVTVEKGFHLSAAPLLFMVRYHQWCRVRKPNWEEATTNQSKAITVKIGYILDHVFPPEIKE